MIVVTTGVPGAGKTLWALTWVKAKSEKEQRPVCYSGIKDLKLPWTEIDPEKWMECEPNSIVVIDECQRVFRPRAHGSNVPKYVADLETHRHLGIDLVLITQHPMLIESNVRRLCGLHFHVVRKWGMQAATVHEWPTIKENCDKSREDSVRHEFKYPKANYGLYHSAEVHTHKARIPYHVAFVVAVPFVVGFAGWRVYKHWFPTSEERLAAVGTGGVVGSGLVAGSGARGVGGSGVGGAGGGGGQKLTASEYVEQFRPRVASLAYTAPVYDEVTKPTEAPYPAACISSDARCKCWTQQATVLAVDESLCRSIAGGGFFIAWRQPEGRSSGHVVSAVPLASSPQAVAASLSAVAAPAPVRTSTVKTTP